ncbi:uncharacterized protein LACBIDRAFT_331512 [Laccaria bicolor S238N-H82]|uniref:Predicted protein n=1 Tax=Laccaria bicolor (strain S238N-H82 / ATCC MYA-4686) TaxID=486041 RepID=B0DPP6_LACBS|nr:uncharacterized protein LACBIDRAFT_331512 [Laccaria bicolor S238N-H82]EDR03486.1 predicted protein [Laccaria bicolor S238N-H82]|eukprot:XP_001885942.1 predicted protein [Laccaria bicolor S238N-H82]
MDLLNEQDFACQEFASYSRSHHEPIPTDCIQIHNQMMSKQAKSCSRRKNTRQNRAEPPTAPAHIPETEGPRLTAWPPTQLLVAITNTPALFNADQAVRNTNITSTPVPLRTQMLIRQGVTGQRTPTAATPQAHLTWCTHTVPPTPSCEKENTPLLASTTPSKTTPSKQSHGDDSLDIGEDEDEAAARIGDESIHQKKKGVHASDLGPARKRIIERAWRHFRFHVATFPYPDSDDQVNKWARESWYAGLGELVEGMGYISSSDPTEDEMALLWQRVYQLHGQIKLHAREVVAACLSLNNSTNIDVVNKNQELIQTYKDHNSFIFQNPFNPMEPATIFRSIMIEDMIIKRWYNERSKSEAILTPMYFEKGIPLETLALICAGLQNALDEWQTGVLMKIPFSMKVYEPVYDIHLTNLCNWHTYTATHQKSAEKLQKDLLIKDRHVNPLHSDLLRADLFAQGKCWCHHHSQHIKWIHLQ